ncbi:hypothetical protein EMIHUDRAFT_461009 [Emiliania huxleyi CCMP1516]|uniref:4-(cytidine 5'-diphospho)-2-C-methyl-D-erythritol kinase n=2 Tax=Emiliania huxleyi TaxID=2903 RepID=A0A0D3L1F9_EMIH1|nr:hypothetical protein EMIHUDRAFT_461009 [Emiliania huxleyi CCMP1516]EOD41844.1 hypothetical protein EMIHUDRAFT_461009 [Emiliania huxleyi CCMP1516]|eukprot:XP_005794273.1 hypothetical protein EMIHUDRAFT_461009 [Emiliania huxleyi CCMP1516]
MWGWSLLVSLAPPSALSRLPAATPRYLRAPGVRLSLDASALSAVGEVEDAAPAPDLRLVAPAKVNLFLRVVGKRPDGFHELASLFQTVSLFDDLDFWTSPREEGAPLASLEVTPDSLGAELIPTDESNLVVRALSLYAERVPSSPAIHCRLHKRIPAQGGLGGGSSDAATALHAANRLAGLPVSQETLIEWAGELGSDCGFFLSAGTAYCTGRGELVDPRRPLPPTACYLIKPAAGLSTPSVFKALGLEPGEAGPAGADPADLLSRFEGGDVYNPDLYVNDREPPAFELMPELRQMCDDLRKFGFQAVMMSGSGTTCFAIGMPLEEVQETWVDELQAKYDVEVFEEMFCRRIADEPSLWYTEQPPGAVLTNIEEPERGLFPL